MFAITRLAPGTLALILALLPIAGVLAPVQIPYVLAVGGVIGLAVALVDRKRSRRVPDSWDPILFALAMGLAAYASLSALWAPDPAAGGRLGLRLSLLFLAAFGFGSLFMHYADRLLVRRAALLGLVLATVLLAVELTTGGIVRETLESVLGLERFKPRTRLEQLLEYSRTGPIAVLLAWPLVWIALGPSRRALAMIVAALLCTAAVFAIPNGAAKVALVAVLAVIAVAALVGRRRAMIMLAAGSIFLALAAPFLASRLAAPDVFAQLVSKESALADRGGYSLMHRFSIWGFAAAKIEEKPVAGWGLDASRRIPGGLQAVTYQDLGVPVDEIHPDITTRMWIKHLKRFRLMKLRLHPHNAALQVWLELGLIGVLIVAALLARAFWLAARDNAWLPVCVGTAGLVLASLSFGLWQGWWMATLLFAACLTLPHGTNRETLSS